MKFQIDGREFIATSEAAKSPESWRKAFPAVYGHMRADVAKSFAARDFKRKVPCPRSVDGCQ